MASNTLFFNKNIFCYNIENIKPVAEIVKRI